MLLPTAKTGQIHVLDSKTLKILETKDTKLRLKHAINGDTSAAGLKGNCASGKPIWFAAYSQKVCLSIGVTMF